MTRRTWLGSIALLGVDLAMAAPHPPKKDVPYLLHAENLIETEVQKGSKKDGPVLSIPGASSPARTPLTEPIFLFASDKIKPEQLGLFRLDVKDGARQLVLGSKKKHEDEEQRSFHLGVRKLDAGLYRLEAGEMLDPGEYALSPEGQDVLFCFAVY